MTEYTEKKDNVLVEMTLLGNERAYEELVIRHQKAVKGTAYKVTGNVYSAEDASQDAFVSAWIHLDSLKDRSRFGSWVCSIAKNCARDLVIHYASAASDVSLELLENTELTASEDEELTHLFADSTDAAKLRSAVEALSEKIREAIRLHYFEGLSVAEIASRLAVPVGTVKWRLSEGRKHLRKEYGVMEKTYDENESLVERVMRQVEQLKLWRVKNNKDGFEAEYRAVLASVEALDESVEKSHALADVLLRGYWWLDSEKNEEVLTRIKAAAEESRNEEVIQSVMSYEFQKYSGKKRIEYIKNVQIPYLEEHGFLRALAYLYFWLGYYCFCFEKRFDEGFEAYEKVLELASPDNVHYAMALAAIRFEKESAEYEKLSGGATGEVLKRVGNKLYFWMQPGYSRGMSRDESLLWNTSLCDGLMFDSDMKVGDVYTDSTGTCTLTYIRDGVTLTTSAGIFENCSVLEFKGDRHGLTYCETAFCEGVGIVRQTVTRHYDTHTWELSSYKIVGGEGIIPFAAGNSWDYTCVDDDGLVYDSVNHYEVTGFGDCSATLMNCHYARLDGYLPDSWDGCMRYARREYCRATNKLYSVEEPMKRAAEIASTKRQKLHTAIATDVMNRIFATDKDYTPDCSVVGRWNFFSCSAVKREGGKVKLTMGRRGYSFEWKDMLNCTEMGRKVLYNFLYDILDDAAGCVWSDEWAEGYHVETDKILHGDQNVHLVLDVLADEAVSTPAGVFENCRHVAFTLRGLQDGWAYRGGKMEYWFAPEIGIVQFKKLHKGGAEWTIWALTDYRGTGNGYFPTDDGLFRRYEAQDVSDGWHGSVEYTFDTDENGTVVFRNALGTQDREFYERDMADAERKKQENRN